MRKHFGRGHPSVLHTLLPGHYTSRTIGARDARTQMNWGTRAFAIALLFVLMLSIQAVAVCNCDPEACCICSPIIVDVTGHGFSLTSAADGVVFDISGTGHPVQIPWTSPGSSNAFLALPGSDGLIHGGKELFGNSTPQPTSQDPNGFKALAVYDLPENGGNGDGIIDASDAVFSALRLWIDGNHDGISQPDELHMLSSLGVQYIGLDYQLSQRRDEYGNEFRFRGEVSMQNPAGNGFKRIAYDVLLTSVNKPRHWVQ